MSIEDDKLFGFMQDVAGTLGRIEAEQMNTRDYLKSIADKATRVEAKIDSHSQNSNAHGLDLVRGEINNSGPAARGWIAIAISGMALVWSKIGHGH